MRPQLHTFSKTRASLLAGLALISGSFAYAADFENSQSEPAQQENQDAIISEKDNIDLVGDSSVQEAINRRPELAFSNVRIDGEESEVSLDDIHSDSVESVEVMKAVTPDLDADSRGSIVSLRSKASYEQTSLKTNGSFAINHDSLIDSYSPEFSINYGGPINASQTVGAHLSIACKENESAYNHLSQDWSWAETGENQTRVLRDARLFATRSDSVQYSLGFVLDCKVSEKLSLYWRNNYIWSETDGVEERLQFDFDFGTYHSISSAAGSSSNARATRSVKAQSAESRKLETGLGGHYDSDRFEFDFKLAYQDDSIEEPDQFTADFSLDNAELSYGLDNRQLPEFFDQPDARFANADHYRFDDLRLAAWKNDKTDLIAAANLRVKDLFKHKNSYLKFGLKRRDRDENQSTSVSFYEGSPSSHANYYLSSALSESHYSDFLFDAYNLHTLPDHQKVYSYFSANEASFDYNFRRSKEDSDPNTYQASEIVDSYYGMINWENEKWRYILGYRYEDATVSFHGSQVLIAEDGSYQETLASIGEKNFGNAFPNAHFRYLWNDNLTIIGSYTETIQRPWYSDIVPSRSIDLQQRFISEGNEDLRPTLYSNWDLSFDIRYSDTAMLSIELFDRSIEDVVFVSRSIISGGEFDGFNLQTKQNSASAENQGIRFTHKQPLDFIPFMPKGLILNTTYTWQDSEIIYPNRPRELLPLPWTSESFIDATLNYDSPHWFFQLKYMHNEPMLARLSSDAWEDAYQIEQERFGLDISYKPDEKRRYFLEITNLLSSPNFENIEGSKFYPIDIRQIPWTARAGIKFEL